MPNRFIALLAVVPLLICASMAAAGDWPMYRADASRSGYTQETIPNRLQLKWVYRSAHSPRPAWISSQRMKFDSAFQPIIMGDAVLFGSSADDRLVCLDAASGKVRWTFFTEAPIRFAPVGWRDRVFVASDDGFLYAVRLADGKLLWRTRGGPNDQRTLGNQRLVSHWPARGGPVLIDNTVYFAAGIWPSDGVYLHAIDPMSGKVKWTNDKSGGLTMPQPHGGANAKSGVAPQGYLLASDRQLFVPTGRAVPASFDRSSGKFMFYHLQANQQRGGSWAMLADNYLINGGCLFDQATGKLMAKHGFGPMVATPEGLLWASGRSLVRYRWKDAKRVDRKGKPVTVRTAEQVQSIQRDREVFELIVAGSEAICGEEGRISAVDYRGQRTTWWTHDVDGTVLGLATAGGRIVASTDRGEIYCFDGTPKAATRPAKPVAPDAANQTPIPTKIDYAQAAKQIIRSTGVTAGYCVDLGAGEGRLALELARRTKLHIYAVESDAVKVAAARRLLVSEGLYGVRVTVHHADPSHVAYPKQFANLVVSSQSLQENLTAAVVAKAHHIQRPYGGKLCIGPPDKMKTETRGELAGAGSWTHQNSDAANTICSADSILRGPLRMFWFRDVDFEVPNRHGQGPTPLSHRGHLIVGGVDGLCSLDAYNGRTEWTFSLPGFLRDYDGIHHDVGVSEAGGAFCLSDDSVYVRDGDRCQRIELATGRKVGEFRTPVDAGATNRNWGYLAFHDGLLFGTVSNDRHTVSPRYKLTQLRNESVLLFAIDPKTGKVRWQYKPKKSIRNNAIAIAGKRLYLIDRALPGADRVDNPRRNGKPLPLLKPGQHEGGRLIALETATGKKVWEQTEDIFGTQLSVSQPHGVLLMYYQAVRHTFFKLPSEVGGRIAAFDAATGKPRWQNKANYQTRPLINDYRVYSQGGSWDLLTGDRLPFKFDRSYGCGQISASANLMLFRSGTLGYRDLTRNAGTENVGGIRPGCWINAIPAGGLVLVPDGSSKCKCSYQMRAWFALQGDE